MNVIPILYMQGVNPWLFNNVQTLLIIILVLQTSFLKKIVLNYFKILMLWAYAYATFIYVYLDFRIWVEDPLI